MRSRWLAASSDWSAVIFPRGVMKWLWVSMNPGSTVAELKSITGVPGGIATAPSDPTSTMRWPWITMTCLVSIFPFTLSNRRPARIATVAAGGGHGMMPPQGRTQGVTEPWDFQVPGYEAGG